LGSSLQFQRVAIYLPLLGLLILVIALYLPQIFVSNVPGLSSMSFMDKTTVLLTFALASFAAVEGYSTFMRASMETKWHKLEDARNELEKAYGPLYTLLNKITSSSDEKKGFWLEFDERKKVDEIMATYPFMFSSQISELWQQKIRKLGTLLGTSDVRSVQEINLDVYVELRNLINSEYARKVTEYHKLLKT
jgi:hypothetical protein